MGLPSTMIEHRGSYHFALPPAAVWDALANSERFESWWWWLGEFRLEGAGLVPGAVLHGLVSPPLPYRMRVQVRLDRCDAPTRIDATVSGDLVGPARLRIAPRGTGSTIEVDWTLEMMQRSMRVAARMAYPLLRWGHDRVVEATVMGFRHQVEADGGPTPIT